MRFVADENLEPVTIEWLRQLGHDVVSIRESARGNDDESILRTAASDRPVIVTYDHDFGELVFRRGQAHAGIVLLRLSATSPHVRLDRLKEHWPEIEARCEGHFIVVLDDRIRVRGFLDRFSM